MGSHSYKKHKKTKHSKKNKHHMRIKTRKMGGGSTEWDTNTCGIPGCRSDATNSVGAHMLHTPLAVRGQNGGGQVCTQNPYQFHQAGGGKRMKKYMKRGRHMKGGDGSFWNFAKFWNSGNPGMGGNVIPLSDKGISPSGLGSPVSTAPNSPMPPIQPWPAQKLILPHEYTIRGSQSGGGKGSKRMRKGKGKGIRNGNSRRRGRGLKGGSVIDDIQTFGRGIAHSLGSVVNNMSGYDNKVYNVDPNPRFQFPRGLGNVTTGASSYNSLNLQKLYNDSYAEASLK
jgi:hypothetical protein